MKHHIRFALGLLLLSVGCTFQNRPAPTTTTCPTSTALAAKLDPILHQLDSSGAIVSARVVDLSNDTELYATHPDDPFTPASNMKLQTGSAALDLLGPDHLFKTYLAMDGDDLWLIGTGDPACGDPDIEAKHDRRPTSMLDDWAEALKAKGITNIKGNLYFYDGAFDAMIVEPSWGKGELTEWYAAPVSGLNFNDNCVDVTVYPSEPGQPARLEVMPPTAGNQIINDSKTATDDQHATVDISRDRDNNTFHVKGIVKVKKTLSSKAVTDPAAFFADALRTNLLSHGITIAGKTERAAKPLGDSAAPPAEKIIATHESKFTDILWRINKNSQNLFAECVSKYEGREFAKSKGMEEPGSWTLGGEAVRAFLEKNHIDDSHLVYVDGSGLSHGNKVTTRLITDELAVMRAHPYHDAYFNSLAIAGKDGTVGKRMDDLKGHVFAKTGFVNGVRALSGYVITRDNKWLAFSIIYNKLPGDVHPAEDLQDNACRVLVEWPDVQNAKLKAVRKPTTKEDE
jgi:D-alanyl-D-alanine carboxypeptidase/D-alanyl-D-alanine-endopeptidase (penicillin-binding protein 4)